MKRRVGLVAATASMALGLAAQAQAATFDIGVGPAQRPAVKADFDQFFPSAITVHVGDTIRWTFFGFHTVSFLAPGQPRPQFAVPDPAHPVTGKRDARGNLFWFNGQPNIDLNSEVAFPTRGGTYDGTQYRNSGVPQGGGPSSPPTTYSLTFTKTGTFHYTCLIHLGMNGTVKVVPASQAVPSQAQDNAAANAQFKADDRVARALTHVRPRGNTVIVGPARGSVFLMAMAPAVRHIHVGDTVTFKMAPGTGEVHTVTFGPEAYRRQLTQSLITPVPNGSGPPTLQFNPLDVYPSDAPPAAPSYNGRNHGNGFVNSGIMDRNPATPMPTQVRIKFTKAGVYHYDCLIHPEMDGTIVVSARAAARRSPSRTPTRSVTFTG